MGTSRSRLAALLVASSFAASSLVASTASASPPFPRVVQETLALDARPRCTLCHTSPSGGAGTANTSFATYLKRRGLRGGDEASLRTALQALIGERHDTDGDGVPDVDELKSGSDPSGDVDASVPPVAYGCGGAHVAPRGYAAPDVVVLAALALGVVLAHRRGSRARRS